MDNFDSDAITRFFSWKWQEEFLSTIKTISNQTQAVQNYWSGFMRYCNDFMIPYLISTEYFRQVEQKKILTTSPIESFESYINLLKFNLDLLARSISGLKDVNQYIVKEMTMAADALSNTLLRNAGEKASNADLAAYMEHHAKIAAMSSHGYPEAIKAIETEYGFHFERGINKKVLETDRFILYQIAPTDKKVEIRKNGKPLIILPPYVLGSNILSFLPGENRSYVHCFANQGIPTYIRVIKDIATTPAVQLLTGEEDARDTAFFCNKIKAKHGKPVTLNGYCQGGFSALCDILSGELDELVDAMITCVSPMDGTKSTGLRNFLKNLPKRFNDLAYGTKTLPNGNKVADGDLMGWVYKLKSIEAENPIAIFTRDLQMFTRKDPKNPQINKSAAAVSYWLANERNDLPLAITEMSFASYNTPISKDGTLPVKLFGKKLNFKRLKEKGIKWLICFGEQDDLVEKETALAPIHYFNAEIAPFPRGHLAIATSWSNPKSACALHTRYGENNYRGPVRYQLDLDAELDAGPSRNKKQ